MDYSHLSEEGKSYIISRLDDIQGLELPNQENKDEVLKQVDSKIGQILTEPRSLVNQFWDMVLGVARTFYYCQLQMTYDDVIGTKRTNGFRIIDKNKRPEYIDFSSQFYSALLKEGRGQEPVQLRLHTNNDLNSFCDAANYIGEFEAAHKRYEQFDDNYVLPTEPLQNLVNWVHKIKGGELIEITNNNFYEFKTPELPPLIVRSEGSTLREVIRLDSCLGEYDKKRRQRGSVVLNANVNTTPAAIFQQGLIMIEELKDLSNLILREDILSAMGTTIQQTTDKCPDPLLVLEKLKENLN